MDGWIMFVRAVFWVAILALAWFVLYRYFQMQEEREHKHARPRRRLVIVNCCARSAWLQRRTIERLQRATPQQRPIAIMQNVNNDALRVALLAKVDAVADLIVAGDIKQTRAIRVVFGLTPSSTNKQYQEIVTLIKQAVERRQKPVYRPIENGQPQPIRST
jgi:hypothetical protein